MEKTKQKNQSLWLKIMLIVSLAFILPTLLLAYVVSIISRLDKQINASSKAALETVVKKSTETMLTSVYTACDMAHKSVLKDLQRCIAAGLNEISHLGGISVVKETTTVWHTVNTVSNESKAITLPKVMLGTTEEIKPNESFQISSAVVDNTNKEFGFSCSIFQRINEAGDMLRIATSFKNEKGQRAIGTIMPAHSSDGSKNEVIEKILRGERFEGTNFILQQTMLSSYAPIKDNSGNVI